MAAPDQSRYGPKPVTPIRHDRKKQITFAPEAGGTTATCLGCGWLAWAVIRRDVEARGRDHACPKRRGSDDADE